MKIKSEWEIIKTILNQSGVMTTARLKVFNGWVVRHNYSLFCDKNDCISESSVFISDPYHEWEIDK